MIITQSNLSEFVNNLIKSGKIVIAPIKEEKLSSYSTAVRVQTSRDELQPTIDGSNSLPLKLPIYNPIKSFSEVNLELPFPTKSAKEYFFASNEKILSFAFPSQGKVEINEPEEVPEVVLFGVRPCETVSYPIIDKVFSWDYKDDFYLKRREKNTIISVACESSDEFCFCTSIGVSPQSTEGSDILMQKTNKGNYLVNAITDKGKKLIETYKNLFTESSEEKPIGYAGPEKKFDSGTIKPWLEKNFENPVWDKITAPCIGCGVCTFLCPNCHCFDITDSANLKEGARYKFWDACQFRAFTVHASGHNPRDTQSKRFRQRIQHKFNYYPDKFGRTLCTGCGRCIRHCPVDMSLLNTLITIDSLAKKKEA